MAYAFESSIRGNLEGAVEGEAWNDSSFHFVQGGNETFQNSCAFDEQSDLHEPRHGLEFNHFYSDCCDGNGKYSNWSEHGNYYKSHGITGDKGYWSTDDSYAAKTRNDFQPVVHHSFYYRPTPDQSNFMTFPSCQVPTQTKVPDSSRMTFQLENENLWEEFHKITNEMIVTKSGRRMFPVLKVKVDGFEPEVLYSVYLDFIKVDSNKWKFSNGEWTPNSGKYNGSKVIMSHRPMRDEPTADRTVSASVNIDHGYQFESLVKKRGQRDEFAQMNVNPDTAGNFYDTFEFPEGSSAYARESFRSSSSVEEHQKQKRVVVESTHARNDISAVKHSMRYQHPDSPNFGRHWNSKMISFTRVKISNKVDCPSDQIYLDSMHKYMPRVTVIRIGNNKELVENTTVAECSFEKASFVAVTAYQNEEVTNLKVKYNPFAKGFQERDPRKSSPLPSIPPTRQHQA